VPHLQAAKAFWDYCDCSVEYIFGSASGDRTADKILRALIDAGSRGMSRTEIRNLLGRNKSQHEIELALEHLACTSRARSVAEMATGGKPKEVWTAT
jgi:predicted transcriptional regulator